jgi:hypothetical protein
MAYSTVPAKEYEYGTIKATAGTGGVTEGTFVAYSADTGVATTATAGALNVGICMETASAGGQTSVKFIGLALLSCDGTTAIAVGDGLDPTTGGVGIKAATDTDVINAVALGALASGTGKILVRVGGVFTLSV